LNLNSKENLFKIDRFHFHISSRQQLDDIQKVLSNEQMKFNEECSKLQHETHEKWMEVKRLTRELEASKKECEGLRRQ
jgi:CDP-diacylglycerol pyrophosphatase